MSVPQPMSERVARPDWVRRLNGMADSVGGDARALVPLDAEDLLAQATRSLGGLPAGDFGDPHWRGRFESLVTGLDAADFHHQLHHKFFECNYGTVDAPWDRWFGSYHDGSDEATARVREQRRRMYRNRPPA